MTILLWFILLVPWATLFFMDKQSIKRYMPVTVFTCLLMTIIFQIAYTYKWWTIDRYIVPWGYMIDVSFSYGIFAVGTMWIFYFTARKFWIYLITNLIVDAIFAFLVLKVLLQGMGIATLRNIQAWQYYIVIFALSLVIYGYHRWQEGVLKSPEENSTRRTKTLKYGFHGTTVRKRAR